MNRFITNHGKLAVVSRAMPVHTCEAEIPKRIPEQIKGLKKNYNPDSELFEDTLPQVWEVLGSEYLRRGKREKNFKSGYESIHKKVLV